MNEVLCVSGEKVQGCRCCGCLEVVGFDGLRGPRIRVTSAAENLLFSLVLWRSVPRWLEGIVCPSLPIFVTGFLSVIVKAFWDGETLQNRYCVGVLLGVDSHLQREAVAGPNNAFGSGRGLCNTWKTVESQLSSPFH